jgi:hypothetical protein
VQQQKTSKDFMGANGEQVGTLFASYNFVTGTIGGQITCAHPFREKSVVSASGGWKPPTQKVTTRRRPV